MAAGDEIADSVSRFLAHIAQSVEHFLGKEEVIGSIPIMSSIFQARAAVRAWLCMAPNRRLVVRVAASRPWSFFPGRLRALSPVRNQLRGICRGKGKIRTYQTAP